jgi:hypothetical protein
MMSRRPEALVGTGLVHSAPTAVHAVEFGAETGAIGRAAIGHSNDIGAAAHTVGDAAAATTDDASHEPRGLTR